MTLQDDLNAADYQPLKALLSQMLGQPVSDEILSQLVAWLHRPLMPALLQNHP